MIIDSLKNSSLYYGMHPLFEKAFYFVATTDITALDNGIHKIEGDDLLVNVNNNARLKTPADAALEVHDRYIDIQVVLEGEETFGWTERSECTGARGVMDSEKDVQFFDGPKALTFKLKAGDFCILFPTDGHAPMIGDPSTEIKKCIFKVKVR